MTTRATERRRVKISVTVEPALLREVDRYVEAHPEADRSKVMDEALFEWYARQQEKAMEEQYAAPVSAEEREEREAWRAIRREAAKRLYRSDGDSG